MIFLPKNKLIQDQNRKDKRDHSKISSSLYFRRLQVSFLRLSILRLSRVIVSMFLSYCYIMFFFLLNFYKISLSIVYTTSIFSNFFAKFSYYSYGASSNFLRIFSSNYFLNIFASDFTDSSLSAGLILIKSSLTIKLIFFDRLY